MHCEPTASGLVLGRRDLRACVLNDGEDNDATVCEFDNLSVDLGQVGQVSS